MKCEIERMEIIYTFYFLTFWKKWLKNYWYFVTGKTAKSILIILIAAAIIIPLSWTGICLPLTYWFGFRSAQTMGLIVVIPMFCFVKYFEDGPGMAAMVNSVHSYVLITGIVAILIFGISLIISTIGYSRKN